MRSHETSGIRTACTGPDFKDWTVSASSLIWICSKNFLIQARCNFQQSWSLCCMIIREQYIQTHTFISLLVEEWRGNQEFCPALESPTLCLFQPATLQLEVSSITKEVRPWRASQTDSNPDMLSRIIAGRIKPCPHSSTGKRQLEAYTWSCLDSALYSVYCFSF